MPPARSGRRPSALARVPLEEGDGATDLGRVHGDELPSILAPGIEDLLGVVRQQWNGRVLPGGHPRFLSCRRGLLAASKAPRMAAPRATGARLGSSEPPRGPSARVCLACRGSALG